MIFSVQKIKNSKNFKNFNKPKNIDKPKFSVNKTKSGKCSIYNKNGHYSYDCWFNNLNKNKFRAINKRKNIITKWNLSKKTKLHNKNKKSKDKYIENNYINSENILNND